MTKRMTQEEFAERVKELTGDEFTFLEEYVKSGEKILVKHNLCGREFKITPNNFLRGTRCARCNGREAWSTESISSKINELTNGEYSLVSPYENAKTNMLVSHSKCGRVWSVLPSNFLRGQRCPKCQKEKVANEQRKTTEEFVEEVLNLTNGEYEVIGKYETARKKILVRHANCGYEYKVLPYAILRGDGCPKCSGVMRRTTAEFKQLVFELAGEEYSVCGEYVRKDYKIRMIHNGCGHEYMVTPHNFINGKRCPKCNFSKGEVAIGNFLSKMNIEYETQYTDARCKDDAILKFDFAIKDENGVALIIEYDGIQHFEPVKYWKGLDGLSTQKRRDEIKNRFCASYGIPMLRIPYWEYKSIEDVVGRKLKELNV